MFQNLNERLFCGGAASISDTRGTDLCNLTCISRKSLCCVMVCCVMVCCVVLYWIFSNSHQVWSVLCVRRQWRVPWVRWHSILRWLHHFQQRPGRQQRHHRFRCPMERWTISWLVCKVNSWRHLLPPPPLSKRQIAQSASSCIQGHSPIRQRHLRHHRRKDTLRNGGGLYRPQYPPMVHHCPSCKPTILLCYFL